MQNMLDINNDEKDINKENGNISTREIHQKFRKAIPVVIGAAAVIIVLLIIILGSKPYEQPVKNFINGIMKNNYSMVVKSLPKEYVNEFNEDDADYWRDEVKYLHDQQIKDYGINVKSSYKIYDANKMDESDFLYYKSVFMKVNNYLEEHQQVLPDDVTDGYIVQVSAESNGSNDGGISSFDFYVLKIKNKWYITDIIEDGYNFFGSYEWWYDCIP